MERDLEAIISGKDNDTYAKIVRVALEAFASETPAAVRMRDIAGRAGVNLALVNYHFLSKENLYAEIARMIVEYQKKISGEFFARFEEVKKSESRAEARTLIADFLASRIRCESEKNRHVRNIILIMMREELCNTEAYALFLKEIFVPRVFAVAKLVEIASGGAFAGESSLIAAKMMLGMTHLFNTARTGFKYDLKWRRIGKKEAERVRAVAEKIAAKILD